MTYTAHEILTFGLIADAWATEVDEPDTDQDGVLHRLVQGMWLGEFEQGGKSLLSLVVPGCALEPGVTVDNDGNIRGLENRSTVTRGGLIRVLELKGMLPKCPNTSSPSSQTGGEGTFSSLATLPPARFGQLVLNAYLAALIVSKDDFGNWCDNQEFERPSFWFAATQETE